MARTAEELEARVAELEREVARLHASAAMPVTGTIAAGGSRGRSLTVSGAEEMILQVNADDRVGYANAPMATLLGMGDRKAAIGQPFQAFDQGPVGEGVLAALVQMGRCGDEPRVLERACPGLPPDRLPPTPGERPAGDPVLRFVAAGVQGRVQVTAQDVTRLRWLEGTFSRYVSPAVIEQMHRAGAGDWMRMERRVLTVLFVDMRGFTRLCQPLPPEGVGELVNAFLADMGACVEALDGTIDKYAGDNVMAFFGAPLEQPDHALRALVCAAEMQRRNAAWLARRTAEGLPAGPCGVGIATAPVVVGNIGTPARVNFTALGHTTNLAARLCGAAGGGEILTLQATYEAAAAQKALYRGPIPVPHLAFAPRGKQAFKNVAEPVEVIAVTRKG